jgi:NADPH:quinone reductase-like Zn-dependent oxidoreductase
VTMRAIRLHPPGRIEDLALEDIQPPQPHPGEVLVQVHAAAITRDELKWPTDRLPAIPSYELSGVVAENAGELVAGTEVFGLTPFDQELLEVARLVDGGELQPEIDSVFSLAEARKAFVPSTARGKHGKVVLTVTD